MKHSNSMFTYNRKNDTLLYLFIGIVLSIAAQRVRRENKETYRNHKITKFMCLVRQGVGDYLFRHINLV